jgi:Restriction endonuclease
MNRQFQPRFCRSPEDFEEAVAEWLRIWGYSDARRTRTGPDGGIDVEARHAAAQVKSWMTPVGSPEVQQVKGAAFDGRQAIFFSLAHYTDAAKKFAKGSGVALFRFTGYDGTDEAVNSFARGMQTRSRPADETIRAEVRAIVDKALASTENACVIHVVGGSRYVQFAWVERPWWQSGPRRRLYLETVGEANLEGDDWLSESEKGMLRELMWNGPDDSVSGNYWQDGRSKPLLTSQASLLTRLWTFTASRRLLTWSLRTSDDSL